MRVSFFNTTALLNSKLVDFFPSYTANMGSLETRQDDILTCDQLLRQRAVDSAHEPLYAFPRDRYGVDNYELIDGETLNRFVDGAAKTLIASGFAPVVYICRPEGSRSG
jgi:hypothetical protein